ncbi:MAG: nitroreductase family protein [Clostridiales bacterium]|nr:nitroreductase family protein [Clostridiales bacterium]
MEENRAYQNLMQRKSARDFLDKEVEPEKKEKIFAALMAAPTTENMMMFSVIEVSDRDIRDKLSRQPAIRKAPLVLVFCADYRRWTRLFDGLSASGRRPQLGEYQLALIDAVLAAQNAVVAAESLGLSSVYLGDIMEHSEDRAAALGLPCGVTPVVTLCIGYATQAQLERQPTRRYEQRYLISENAYQDYSREELESMVQHRLGHESLEQTQEWLRKFAKRCVDGKGALERTRSIESALSSWGEISFDTDSKEKD